MLGIESRSLVLTSARVVFSRPIPSLVAKLNSMPELPEEYPYDWTTRPGLLVGSEVLVRRWQERRAWKTADVGEGPMWMLWDDEGGSTDASAMTSVNSREGRSYQGS